MKLIKSIFLAIVLVVSLSAREQVNINFSNLQIDDFIKLVSKITHKNILMNNKITGTVNFISATPVYDDELMDILISVLDSKGFTLVENGSLYEIIRSNEVAQNNVKVVKPGKSLKGPLMVTQAISVKGENSDIIAAKIRHLNSKNAKLMSIKESNTLIITDYPKNIETIKKVIKEIDTNNQAVVKIIPIKYAEAKKLQTKLEAISKLLFNEKVAAQKVKVILDENLNSIIVVGSQENVKVIASLIQKLDIESNVSNTVQIFKLKNSDAKSVLESLTEIISKRTYSDPALKPNISASTNINGIIAVGEPNVLKGIKYIIDELDMEKYQVYVKARIIEISSSNTKNLGIKYGFDGANLSAEGLYSLAANFGGQPVVGIVGDQLASSVVGSGVTAGFALGAAMDFLERNGASRSISNPSILCVNNKESSIYVGKTMSFSTGTISNAATVGTGLTSSYKREDVGLTLKIKPRVSSAAKVTLDVEVILENVLDDGSNNATKQPVTSKQEVKTQAILRHGESIIIGGLVKNYDMKSVSKVPVLGDLPLFGKYLFSSTTDTIEQDNLIVVLTPYVIDKSEKLSQLQKELGIVANLQQKYDSIVFKKIEEKGLKKSEKKKNKVLESN
ncbi:MAG: type II secretion system secretin GspD [Sulfurospirillaceae bacterium]|nr:type II secretion system secretin GspD [Sulfurospirillaceae bacterium]